MTNYKNKTTDELKTIYKAVKGSGSPSERYVKEELEERGQSLSELEAVKTETPDISGKSLKNMTSPELSYVEKTSHSPGVKIEEERRAGKTYPETKKTSARPTFDYRESEAVTSARKALEDSAKPAVWDTESEYSPVAKAYEKLSAREPFSYNVDADALYKQYRDKYLNAGRKAMEDAYGKASVLTGGYGNSYAATVGSEAYGKYLSELDDVLPELYKIALSRYNDEGERLQNAYKTAKTEYDDRYGEYRDRVEDAEKERKLLADNYKALSDADYKRYKDAYANAVDEYDYGVKAKEKEAAAAKTESGSGAARTYKYADYASVERRAAEFKGKPETLSAFLKAMEASGLISEAARDELYERFKE